MEMPVSMETGETETPAAVTAVTAGSKTAVTAGRLEPCLTPDTVMEDRGVDLSFDCTEPPRVKPEPGTEPVLRTDTRVSDVRDIKQECDHPPGDRVKQEAQLLQSPGGRLKIFQSKSHFTHLFIGSSWKVPLSLTTMMQIRVGDR